MKKCKGSGKAKGFGCGEPLPFSERNGLKTYNAKYGLGLSSCGCFSKWLRNSEDGKKMLNSAITTAQKPRLDLEIYKEESKKNKSLSYLKLNTVNICHAYIRLRDKFKNCISCGGNWHTDFHAGHFYSAKQYSSLKFDETNISGQCPKCNNFEDGNEGGYRLGLIERHSKGYLDLLDSKALLEKHQGFKWDRFKLNDLQEYYRDKLKKLKDEQ
jgi:hypothetical protein